MDFLHAMPVGNTNHNVDSTVKRRRNVAVSIPQLQQQTLEPLLSSEMRSSQAAVS